LFADSIGSAIATHLLMRYSRARSVTAPRGLTRRQLQSVTDFINENLSENLSLSELAAVAGAGVSHFKALFKRTTGLPVHQYVIRRWVDFAIKLLSRPNARLSDIARQAGFADQSHMTRAVRRVVGITPAELFRQYR
jgi:AraC family transcriptional regulator